MSATSLTPRLTRLVTFAVAGATALSVAACSHSNNENTGKPSASTSTTASSTSAVPKPPPRPPVGKDVVEGLVRSVAGNTIHLEQRNRTAATVDFTPQTMVTELTPAQLSDVTPGSCVDVEASPASAPPGGAVTAQSVTINPSEGDRCPPPEPTAPGSASPPGVFGKVTSVTGNTIAVTSLDPTGQPTPATVSVTNTTTYSKHAVTNPQAIQDGKCMAARGTQDGGVLHATTIDLEPCPSMGRPHHHFYIPDIGDIPIPPIPPIPHIPDIPNIPDIPHLP